MDGNNQARYLTVFIAAFALAWFVLPLLSGYSAAKFKPDVILPDNTRYSGDVKNGVFHGYGNLVSNGVFKYAGNFENGLFHGYGAMVYESGETYEGDFFAGLEHGQAN